jgi:signal transduction histidine kinase
MSLVDVRIECPSGPISPSTAQAVGDALEECAANAFRHGHATRLDCRIERSERHVHLTVRDDGHSSSSATSTPGLGSRILDRCGTWTRAHDAGGTTVTISIPI